MSLDPKVLFPFLKSVAEEICKRLSARGEKLKNVAPTGIWKVIVDHLEEDRNASEVPYGCRALQLLQRLCVGKARSVLMNDVGLGSTLLQTLRAVSETPTSVMREADITATAAESQTSPRHRKVRVEEDDDIDEGDAFGFVEPDHDPSADIFGGGSADMGSLVPRSSFQRTTEQDELATGVKPYFEKSKAVCQTLVEVLSSIMGHRDGIKKLIKFESLVILFKFTISDIDSVSPFRVPSFPWSWLLLGFLFLF